MALPASTDIQLTPEQSKVLGKLKAYSNYASFLPRLDLYLPKSKQVSLFDFMKQIFSAIGNRNVFDTLLRQFLNTIFNPNSNLLERKALEAMASSFDQQNIILSSQKFSNGKFRYSADGGLNPSNKEFLMQEVLPYFTLSKDIILAEIMALIFGPASNIKKFNPTFTDVRAVEYASCGGSIYTISNLPNQGVGDIEYQKAQLQQRIQNGGIVFEISCQEVVIKLPENYTATLFPGGLSTVPGTNGVSFNPDTTIQLLENFVQAEVARQNIPENQSSASKSFRESFIEKLLNTITFSIMNQLTKVFDIIENKGAPIQVLNGSLSNATANIVSNVVTNQVQNALNQTIKPVPRNELESFIRVSPCDVYSIGIRGKSGEDVDAAKKKFLAFATFLINAILGILLSILIRRLIKEIKSLLAKVIAKKAQDLAQRLAKKRLAIYEAYFNSGKAEVERKIKLANALKKLAEVIKSF
jgi:hypothetical protein